MNPNIDISKVKKMCEFLIEPTYFLMYFTKKQLISDIKFLNHFSIKNKGRLSVAKLYYNKITPSYIREYSDNAKKEFPCIVDYLKRNDKKLKDISSRLAFVPEPEVYAWVWRKEVKKILQVCEDKNNEAIFCSFGAYQVIRNIMKKSRVIPIATCFGGCINFALGMTVKSILSKIKELSMSGISLKRIYLPHTMFCVEGKYDLNLDSITLIRSCFPKVKICVLKTPYRVLFNQISLKKCLDYYENCIP